MKRLPITAAIVVKNGEKYLLEILERLKNFDEVLLLDNGSTDNTLVIAGRYHNCSIYQQEQFIGFGAMKNLAVDKARNDWIFSIDSDEIPDNDLLSSMANIDFTQLTTIYLLSRLNHYRGRVIKGCGWYPDIIPRVFNRQYTHFSNRYVHERIEIPTGAHLYHLSGELKHYSYQGASELIDKMQSYSTLYAQENQGKKKATMLQAVAHGLFAFIKSYFFKQGFRYGGDGVLISISNAMNSFFKYVKLREKTLS